MRLTSGRIGAVLHSLGASGAVVPENPDSSTTAERRHGSDGALLLLHGLWGSAADWNDFSQPWDGPVYALDLPGHGRSPWIKGGAYTPEILAAVVDTAIARIEATALVGAGLGAYIALLLAGTRNERIRSAVLLPGSGLAGGGAAPRFDGEPTTFVDRAVPRDGCDPMLCFLEEDVRPPDYAVAFARRAQRLDLRADGAADLPPWWIAVRDLEPHPPRRGPS
jgi:pimeloyl-ACP methyl ester carboxylesterase